jgi:GT2 family glycosyltransferase
MVSIIVISHNRLNFLSKCVEAVISSTENLDKELIIWDNSSDDKTVNYIKKLENEYPFIKPKYYRDNIGVNAKSKSFEISKGDYIVCLDDDIIELPENWVTKMIKAFESFDKLGYLALDVVQNEHTTGAKYPKEDYTEKEFEKGVILQFGPVGGWCFMIPRRVYNIVGPLRQMRKKIFFAEDGDYVLRCRIKGYESAILKGVKCFHATGPYYNEEYKEIFDKKMSDWKLPDTDFHKLKRSLSNLISKIKKRLIK